TQQLVRNLYIGNDQRTLQRKLREACLALRLAAPWSRNRILTTYLNQAYYGNHAYGIQAAAQTYFSRRARQLSLAQAALLAGLPQPPSVYDPFEEPGAAPGPAGCGPRSGQAGAPGLDGPRGERDQRDGGRQRRREADGAVKPLPAAAAGESGTSAPTPWDRAAGLPLRDRRCGTRGG